MSNFFNKAINNSGERINKWKKDREDRGER